MYQISNVIKKIKQFSYISHMNYQCNQKVDCKNTLYCRRNTVNKYKSNGGILKLPFWNLNKIMDQRKSSAHVRNIRKSFMGEFKMDKLSRTLKKVGQPNIICLLMQCRRKYIASPVNVLIKNTEPESNQVPKSSY